MKIIKLLPILLVTMFVFSSCETESDLMEDCTFTDEVCRIMPFCSWPPSPNADIALPVAFQYNGDFVSHEDYNFEWSSDSSFKSGAISLRYDDLPVTVKVTEIATGCEVEATLAAF